MTNEISWDDPQFMSFLENCLRAETETIKNRLSDLKNEIKEFKSTIKNQLRARRELKNKTRNVQENYSTLATASNKQRKYINETCERIELMKLNLDSDYKVKKMECDQFEKICNEYEKTWQEYRMKYEEFPLAKERKVAKIRSEKLRVEKMVIEYKLNALQKTRRLNRRIKWFRMRVKIVEFARVVSNGRKLDETLRESKDSIEDCKEELIVVNAELETRTKRQEEEKRNRALKMLEMPPPTINFTHIRSIYGRRQRNDIANNYETNYENSLDSISVDTVMLEEMCAAEESSVLLCTRELYRTEDRNSNVEDEQIDETNPSPDQEDREKSERDDVASETDENEGQGAIDPAANEEMEQEPLEEFAFPSNVSTDRQTVQRSEDRADGPEIPPAKRMKMIPDEEEASPAIKPRTVRAEKKRSESVGTTSGPRITRIETIRYNVSPTGKQEQGCLNPAVGSRGSQLSLASKTATPARKLDQDNPNPSSMFTPRHYDCSDSVFSFCVDNNSSQLKDDQISMYGGSVRNLCECSNISTPLQETEMATDMANRARISSTSKQSAFPQFDFSNIMKGNTGRKSLF